jgi:ferredoxin
MAIRITDDCINCEACEPECPNNAIYAPEETWKMSDGTSVNNDTENEAGSDDFFYIATDKCTECIGFHEEPQCAAVCPVDCCVADDDNVESEAELMTKKDSLHV